MKTNRLSRSNPAMCSLRTVLFCAAVCLCTALQSAGKPAAAAMANCTSLRSMARIYMACGDYSKAQPLAEKALEMAQQNSPSDEELAACFLDLAYLYKDRGMFTQAAVMCEHGLKVQRQFLPKDHPQIAQTLRMAGMIQRGLAQYKEARQTLERAIATVLPDGVNDERTLAPYRVDLARILMDQADYAAAQTCLTGAMKSIESVYGVNHTYTARVRTDLARLYVLLGHIDMAESQINRSLKVLEKTYGPNHHYLVSSWMTEAQIYTARGDYGRAQKLLEKSLQAIEKKRGVDNPLVGQILNDLGELQIRNRHYSKAGKTLERAVDILTTTVGTHNDLTAMASNNLARVCLQQGDCDQADRLTSEALDTLLEIFEPTHPKVAAVLETRAKVDAKAAAVAKASN